ncbi:unnamed protein product [Amaranthus hypochondriacus]
MKSVCASHSSSSTGRRSSKSKGPLLCHHGVPAKLQLAKRGSRIGSHFYGCGYWPEQNCKFFRWESDVVIPSCIEVMDNEEVLDKIQQLKKKNKALKEEVGSLRVELAKMNNSFKSMSYVVVVSWFIFGIFLFFIN